MKFAIKPTEPHKIDTDLLISFSFERKLDLHPSLRSKMKDAVEDAAQREDFSATDGQMLILPGKENLNAYKMMVVGLGSKSDFTFDKLYEIVAKAVKKTQKMKIMRVAVVIPDEWVDQFSIKTVIQTLVEASSLASYRFIHYKSEEEKAKLKEIKEVVLLVSPAKLSMAEEGLRIGLVTSAATLFARDLINEPPQITTPAYLAKTALEIAKSSKGLIKAKIFEKEEAEKLGMEAFLGVSRGSDEPPKFIHLSYKPARANKKIVLIGKGITFDTGGLSLKPPEHMETMKLDMSGAATVLGIFKGLIELQPQVNVVGLIAACENMPSGKALKPGDILRAMNGKTIEVLNTDAEGRLTLADMLSYAEEKEKPDEMIDLATLTGACMIALGQQIAGMWGNDDKLIQSLEKSAHATGEKIWKMPLEQTYKRLIKSHIADVKNIQTGRYGGAITAALFLSEFVKSTPWIHLDIAGPAYEEEDTPLVSQGGAGFGVRMLLHHLSNYDR